MRPGGMTVSLHSMGLPAGRIRYRSFRPSSLSPTQASKMFESMREVAGAATADTRGSTWIASDWESRRIQFDDSRCYSAWSSDDLIGFMWTRRLSVGIWRVVHLQAAYVLPAYHGRGIGYSLNARMILREAARLLGARSVLVADMASPVAFHGWRSRARHAEDFYPLVDGDGKPELSPLEVVAESVASAVYPGLAFDSATGVLHSKTDARRGLVQASGERAVDGYFDEFVRGESGDTALVVMRPRAMEFLANGREVVRAVPRALRRTPGRIRYPANSNYVGVPR